MDQTQPLLRLISVFFKSKNAILKLINVNVHPVSGAGIRTRVLFIMSLLP